MHCRPIPIAASRRCATLCAASILLLANSAVQADPYDQEATEGELQVVCHLFTINFLGKKGMFAANCNYPKDGSVWRQGARIDLSSEIDDNCLDGLSIAVTDDEVYLNARCDLGGNDVSYVGTELNDLIEWVAAEKAFRWKAGYGPST